MTTTKTDKISLSLRGQQLLENSLLNKGTAFSNAERDAFGLHGLLPDHVETLDEQVARAIERVRAAATNLDRHNYLRNLQDTNETLYYALITKYLTEILPLIYTPTVGAACQQFSHLFNRSRGLFLTLSQKDKLDQILANPRFDNIECIVVTDGERILGLGDQGAGGMGIPIGKLSIYAGCGGIHPANSLPITLDVGTNNQERLADPMYIGARHARVRGKEYDEFVEAFVQAVMKRWPDIMLQWEDFGKTNANRLLDKYRDRLCTFNDDIQGTAVVAIATLIAAINVTGVSLKDQYVVLQGGGQAGCGIAALMAEAMIQEGLSREEAYKRFYVIDINGLLKDDTPDLEDFQKVFRRSKAELANWKLDNPNGNITLLDTIRNVPATVLIGVSAQSGAFSEQIIREMASKVERPIVCPLSNPTEKVEARPEDIINWTDGRAVIGTGSPFGPIDYKGKSYNIAQINNSYVFPGMGLGAIAVKARRVTDGMFIAVAKELAAMSPELKKTGAGLLPPIADMRNISYKLAVALAKQARNEGLTDKLTDAQIEQMVKDKMWVPEYPEYVAA
ncbi:MAG: NAD-dependent malic enzyme [Burkholderiaceae bacterium]|nr:NAD-dependent malic enzyme [Burkholderiaceae bacterium]